MIPRLYEICFKFIFAKLTYPIPLISKSEHEEIYEKATSYRRKRIYNEESIPRGPLLPFKFLPTQKLLSRFLKAIKTTNQLINILNHIEWSSNRIIKTLILTTLQRISAIRTISEKVHLFRLGISKPLKCIMITPYALVYIYEDSASILNVYEFSGTKTSFNIVDGFKYGFEAPWDIQWSICGRYLLLECLDYPSIREQEYKIENSWMYSLPCTAKNIASLPCRSDYALSRSVRYIQIIDIQEKQFLTRNPYALERTKFFQYTPPYLHDEYEYDSYTIHKPAPYDDRRYATYGLNMINVYYRYDYNLFPKEVLKVLSWIKI